MNTIKPLTIRHQIAAWLAMQLADIKTSQMTADDDSVPDTVRESALHRAEYLRQRLEALPDEPTMADINAATGNGWIHPYTCACCARPATDAVCFELQDSASYCPRVYLCLACLQEGITGAAAAPNPDQGALF